VLVSVRPSIGQIHLATFWPHIGERIEHVSEFFGWEVLRVVVATINSLSSVRCALVGVN
jgi:hypothetical protein